MREEFQQLADLRAEEAAVLAKNGKEQGAYYLAGLAIECALKACIAKRTRGHQYPPKNTGQYYDHNLDVLLQLADLCNQLEGEMKRSARFANNRDTVHDWDVEKRYEATGLKGTEMVTAVNSVDGVLQRLKHYWCVQRGLKFEETREFLLDKLNLGQAAVQEAFSEVAQHGNGAVVVRLTAFQLQRSGLAQPRKQPKAQATRQEEFSWQRQQKRQPTAAKSWK